MKVKEHYKDLADITTDDGKLVGHAMKNGGGYWIFHVDVAGTRFYHQKVHITLETVAVEAGEIFNKAVA